MFLAYDDKNVVVGAGQILHYRRGSSHVTVTPTGTPTTTSFTVADATDMPATGAKLKVGDVLQLASATPAYTAVEASTAPRITALVSSGGNTTVTVSPAFSVAPAASAGAVRVLYRNLGATDGDITVKSNITRTKQMIDQAVDAVQSRITSREVTITAPLAEITTRHFALGLGIAPGTDDSVMQVGSTISANREDRILCILPGPNGTDAFLVAHRASHEGEASLVASKEKKGIVNLNLVLMPDTSFGATALIDYKEATAA